MHVTLIQAALTLLRNLAHSSNCMLYSICHATSLEKVLNKLKKIFMHKNLNHVLETQGKHISYSKTLKRQLEKVHKSLLFCRLTFTSASFAFAQNLNEEVHG